MSYEEKLDKIDFFENTWQDAVNQTEMYRLIKSHFLSPPADGKKVKKAVVIGYDGCTCEMLNYTDIIKRSAVKYLLSNGGHGVFSFAGGKPWPEPISQQTSTAPGWCSMLTGTLADVNKIKSNGIIKDIEPKTLFIELTENGLAKGTAFYVSWGGHFRDRNSTYLNEKNYIAEKSLNCEFVCARGDDGTLKNTLDNIKKRECSDFIFSIFEYTDHNGHSVDYLPQKPKYMQAYSDAESAGFEIINAIKGRESFDEEDWLILITSDHGGFERDHGGATLQERITFIVSNKEI